MKVDFACPINECEGGTIRYLGPGLDLTLERLVDCGAKDKVVVVDLTLHGSAAARTGPDRPDYSSLPDLDMHSFARLDVVQVRSPRLSRPSLNLSVLLSWETAAHCRGSLGPAA